MGLLLALWQSIIILSYLYWIVLIGFLVIIGLKFFSKKLLLQLLYVLFAFLTGYFWEIVHIQDHLRHVLHTSVENKIITVKGYIVSVPTKNNHSQQFQFQTQYGKVLLSWYTHTIKNAIPLIPGQQWQLTLKLKKPHGYRNPGSVDYDAWCFEENIMAKGYVIDNALYKSELIAAPGWHHFINHIRQHLEQQWAPFQQHWSCLGVLLGLTLGLTHGITSAQWQVFIQTGTIHLMAISGFHIGLVAGIAYNAVNFLWRRITFLCERWPAQRAGALGAIFAGFIYALLAGFSIPTQRSLIMLSVFMGGILFRRQTQPWQCFRLSLLAVILWNPFAPLSRGFWLSFCAVGIILYVMDKKLIGNSMGNKLKQAVILQIQIFLGLMPVCLFWFSQVSVTSLWANLVAIPATGCVILPLALLAMLLSWMPHVAINIMWLAEYSFEQLFRYLNYIGQDHAVIWYGSLNHVAYLCIGMLAMLLLLKKHYCLAGLLFLPLLIILYISRNNTLLQGEAYLSVLDVGQGLASVIQTQHHALVFDTGPKFSETFDTGKAVVLPYLRHEHIDVLDALIISHADLDHSGGLQSVLSGIPVKKVFVNHHKILHSAQLCQSHISWVWDGVRFEFLTRGLEQQFDTHARTNDTCCVLKISNAYHSILLPGDLEAQGEKILIREYGNALKTNLIVAGHHGSKTSSSLDWVNITMPHFAIMATGYLNRYHFPHPMIVGRYQAIGAQTASTSDCGMIGWLLPNTPADASISPLLCYQKAYPHPWYV